MITATCKLKSASPLSFSKVIMDKKNDRELPRDFEERIWRSRMHTENDKVIIPAPMLANSLKSAAKYLSISIPGKGKEKYTKNFEASVLVPEPLITNILADRVMGEWVFVPSDGKKGGSSRVWKCFPVIQEWSGDVTYYIFDDIIDEDIFTQVLRGSGQFIGLGRFRPIRGGYYGRYRVDKIDWVVSGTEKIR